MKTFELSNLIVICLFLLYSCRPSPMEDNCSRGCIKINSQLLRNDDFSSGIADVNMKIWYENNPDGWGFRDLLNSVTTDAEGKFEFSFERAREVVGGEYAIFIDDFISESLYSPSPSIKRFTNENLKRENEFVFLIPKKAFIRVKHNEDLELLDFENGDNMRLDVRTTFGEEGQFITKLYELEERYKIGGNVLIAAGQNVNVELVRTQQRDGEVLVASEVIRINNVDTSIYELKLIE